MCTQPTPPSSALPAGPLAEQQWSLLQTWALLAAPIVPVTAAGGGGSSKHAGDGGLAAPPSRLVGRWLLKAATTGAVVFTLLRDLPPWVCSCLFAIGIYSMLGALRCAALRCDVHAAALLRCAMPGTAWLDAPLPRSAPRLLRLPPSLHCTASAGVVMDGPAALVLRLLRLRLAPHFRAPWESRSFAVSWARGGTGFLVAVLGGRSGQRVPVSESPQQPACLASRRRPI